MRTFLAPEQGPCSPFLGFTTWLHSPLPLCLVQVRAGSGEQWHIQDPETFLGDGRYLEEEETCRQGELVGFSSLRLSLSYRRQVRLLEIEPG